MDEPMDRYPIFLDGKSAGHANIQDSEATAHIYLRGRGEVPTLVITIISIWRIPLIYLRLVEGLAGHQKVGVGGHDEQAFERRVLDEALALTKALAIHHPHHIAERLQGSVAAVHLSRGSSHYQVHQLTRVYQLAVQHVQGQVGMPCSLQIPSCSLIVTQ